MNTTKSPRGTYNHRSTSTQRTSSSTVSAQLLNPKPCLSCPSNAYSVLRWSTLRSSCTLSKSRTAADPLCASLSCELIAMLILTERKMTWGHLNWTTQSIVWECGPGEGGMGPSAHLSQASLRSHRTPSPKGVRAQPASCPTTGPTPNATRMRMQVPACRGMICPYISGDGDA